MKIKRKDGVYICNNCQAIIFREPYTQDIIVTIDNVQKLVMPCECIWEICDRLNSDTCPICDEWGETIEL